MVELKQRVWCAISCLNFDVEQLRRIAGSVRLKTLQPPIVIAAASRRDPPLALAEEIGVIAYSPMGVRLLTGR